MTHQVTHNLFADRSQTSIVKSRQNLGTLTFHQVLLPPYNHEILMTKPEFNAKRHQNPLKTPSKSFKHPAMTVIFHQSSVIDNDLTP